MRIKFYNNISWVGKIDWVTILDKENNKGKHIKVAIIKLFSGHNTDTKKKVFLRGSILVRQYEPKSGDIVYFAWTMFTKKNKNNDRYENYIDFTQLQKISETDDKKRDETKIEEGNINDKKDGFALNDLSFLRSF